MALDTINIPNTVGATLRSNINNAFIASATAFSGTIRPTTGTTGLASLIGVLWYDTSLTPSVLKVGTETGGTFVVVDAAVDVGATSVGGVLDGTVANASINADAVGSSQIASGAVGVAELKGGTPSAMGGQVLTASDSTTFAWTDAAGGGNGGFLNGAGTIEAKGNRMIISGSGGGGGGAQGNGGNGGTGGTGYNTSLGVFSVAKGETVTVTVGGGGGGLGGGFGQASSGDPTTLTWTGGSITLGGGGGSSNVNSNRGAAGVITLSGTTKISVFAEGAQSGSDQNFSGNKSFTSGAWTNPGGNSGTTGGSGGGGGAGRCTIIGFFDA